MAAMASTGSELQSDARFLMICASVGSTAGTVGTKGALTKAFLNVFSHSSAITVDNEHYAWSAALQKMYEKLPRKLIPAIWSDEAIGTAAEACLFPKNPSPHNSHWALLIGTGNMTDVITYLKTEPNFCYNDNHVTLLNGVDRGLPSTARVKDALAKIATESRAGDLIFLYISGASIRVDGVDCLVPLIDSNDSICASDIKGVFFDHLPSNGGVIVRVLMDAANCGSIFQPSMQHQISAMASKSRFVQLWVRSSVMVDGCKAWWNARSKVLSWLAIIFGTVSVIAAIISSAIFAYA